VADFGPSIGLSVGILPHVCTQQVNPPSNIGQMSKYESGNVKKILQNK
jgi:hypothetical protein